MIDLIKSIKNVYKVKELKKTEIDLSIFSILDKGDLFKNLNTWRLLYTLNDMYLFSIRNSYKELSFGLFGDSGMKVNKEVLISAVMIKVNYNLPDLIIRPSNIEDKIVDLFYNFDIKLKNRKKFNSMYILEANSSKNQIEMVLTKKITDELEKNPELHLEIKNSEILLSSKETVNIENTIKLIRIAMIIDKEIKNVA